MMNKMKLKNLFEEIDTFLKLGLNSTSKEFLIVKVELKPQKLVDTESQLAVKGPEDPVIRLQKLWQAYLFNLLFVVEVDLKFDNRSIL